jgi:phosphoribosylformimino-5-aminoimidazole carboxamide ribotide isomerase
MGGVVVRGIGGRRDEYRPIVSQIAADAQPATVAGAFRKLGCNEAYVADLDAIAGKDLAESQYEAIAGDGLQLWLDAGVSLPERAWQLSRREFAGQGLHRIVVGLESLESIDLLNQLFAVVGFERLVFSLDLKRGVPMTAIPKWQNLSPTEIAGDVLERGIRNLIVLDLADVGEARGLSTHSLCRQIRAMDAGVELIAGGGIRNQSDLNALADAGCNAALVASALHDARLQHSLVSNSQRALSN